MSLKPKPYSKSELGLYFTKALYHGAKEPRIGSTGVEEGPCQGFMRCGSQVISLMGMGRNTFTAKNRIWHQVPNSVVSVGLVLPGATLIRSIQLVHGIKISDEILRFFRALEGSKKL